MEGWKQIFKRTTCPVIGVVSLFISIGCGEISELTHQPPTPPVASPAESTPAVQGKVAVILGANFTDSTGTINVIPLQSPRTASTHLTTTHSDATVRSFSGLIYVINRKGADNIQIIDPSDFKTVLQLSTGLATNPQDIAVVSASKAYVTLYEPEENQTPGLTVDDLLIIDLSTGTIARTIDLTPFTWDDGDRFARASSLLLIDNKLYIAIQDLPGNLALRPDQPGKLLRLDTRNEQIDAALTLECRNPFSMSTSPKTGKIFVGCADFFDLRSPYGGVEAVRIEPFETEGIFLDDLFLDGWLGDLEVSGEHGFAVVGATDYSENRIVRFSMNEENSEFTVLYRSGSYLQEIAVSDEGDLLVGDRNPEQSGVLFLDPATGAVLEGPINVGAAPSSIAFVER